MLVMNDKTVDDIIEQIRKGYKLKELSHPIQFIKFYPTEEVVEFLAEKHWPSYTLPSISLDNAKSLILA